MSPGWVCTRASTNGITLQVTEAGPADGPLVVLLHGFPEPSICWRGQIGPLSDAGFRVLAPDQRGYGTSDKPRGVASYAIDELAADVVGLIDSSGRPSARLVGHDWGGIVAWWVALRHPERVEQLAIINAPHPVAFRRRLLRSPGQLLRSWYTFFFQIPALPEALLRRRHCKNLERLLTSSSPPGTFSAEYLAECRQAWSQPGALTAMLNWYRAAYRPLPRPPVDPRVRVPTLIVWGKRDPALSPRVAEDALALCNDGRIHWLPETSHWVPDQEPELLSRLLLEFFGAAQQGTGP